MQKSLITLMLFSIGIFIVSCVGSDDPKPSPQKTAEQEAVEKLTGGSSITWTTANGGTVTKDEIPVTADFSGFELRLTSTASNRTYSTTPNPLFDQSGSWSFPGGNFDKIQFTGTQPTAGREISFSRNGDKLNLNFSVPMPNSRVSALAGSYTFELIKK